MLKGYKIVEDVKPGGTFLLNCQWDAKEIDKHLSAETKRYIANNNIRFYTVNAIDKAREIGMGKVGQPLRIAVTGSAMSPGIGDTMMLVGRERTLKRIEKAIEHFGA